MIEARDLHFRYPAMEAFALRGINLKLAPGESVAMMGPNGSGKSTLVRCLCGLLQPTSGTVTVHGTGRVGVVFQNPYHQITSPTVEREIAFGLQNLRRPREEISARVEGALRDFGLSARRAFPPARLSAGEMQRLALASVLVLDPAFLILDEATSLLSPVSRNRLLDRVLGRDAADRMGILLITQFRGEAARAGRRLTLEQGRIASEGMA